MIEHIDGHISVSSIINDLCVFCVQVQPKHVKEAFRLLNKSIIRVEQPVINFDEEDDEPIPMDDTEDKTQDKMETDEPTQEKEKDVQEDIIVKKKPGMHMSFEDYKQTSNLLVLYMRQEEEKEGMARLIGITIPYARILTPQSQP